jgi:hypothetical protein
LAKRSQNVVGKTSLAERLLVQKNHFSPRFIFLLALFSRFLYRSCCCHEKKILVDAFCRIKSWNKSAFAGGREKKSHKKFFFSHLKPERRSILAFFTYLS